MSKPRPFDLDNHKERARLIRELAGYMRVTLQYGTDSPGRRYAYEAVNQLSMGIESGEFTIVKHVSRKPAPFVFDDE